VAREQFSIYFLALNINKVADRYPKQLRIYHLEAFGDKPFILLI